MAGEDWDFGREAADVVVVEELAVFGGTAEKESNSSSEQSRFRLVGVVRDMLPSRRCAAIA